MKKILMFLLIALLLPLTAAAQQAYVVLDGTNLSFYYDSNLNLRTGTKYLLTDTDENGMPAWVTPAGQRDVVSVSFDQSFANYRPTTTKNWFYNLGHLTELNNIKNLNTSQVTDMSYMFSGCEALTTLDLSSFDTRNLQNFRKMFTNCRNMVSLNVKGWNTEKATDMFQMFLNCWSLKTLDLGSFSLPCVENMNMMFMECKTLIALNLNLNNAAKLTQSEYMFFNCKKLSRIYTPNEWVTPALTKSENMFNGCEALQGEKGTTYDESHLDKAYAHLDGGTSNPGYLSVAQLEAYVNYDSSDLTFYYDYFKDVRTGENFLIRDVAIQVPSWCYLYRNDIRTAAFDQSFADYRPTVICSWFYGCSALEDIYGLEYLNTSEVTDMNCMFYECKSLQSLNLSNFDTRKVMDMNGMFWHCEGLKSVNLSSFDTGNVINMRHMFYGCQSLTSLNVTHFRTSKVTNMAGMFGWCNALTTLDLSNFDTSNVTDMDYMFYLCHNLSNLRIENFKTGKVTDMSNMFSECKSLTSLDLKHFDTGNVTTMETMFWGCSALTSLDVSSFNTSKVTNMKMMFCQCKKLKTIKLNNFDTRNVTTMQRMFEGSEKLDYLDLSSFNTAKVTDMWGMFWNNENITTIYAGPSWSTENVAESTNMFLNCKKLVGEEGTTYDENHTDHLYARVDGGPTHPGYFTLKLLRGDVNGDGLVNSADVQKVYAIMAQGGNANSHPEADVNGDGNINSADIQKVYAIMAGVVIGPQAPAAVVAIDLGLPSGTKWANMNVGANTPEEYGDYFAWGETKPKDSYNWSNYQYGDFNNLTNIGSDIAGNKQYDAATANWGSPWKMPTEEQFLELLSNCNSEWTQQNGVGGWKFTSRQNGESIFLPAAGFFLDSIKLAGQYGTYFSSTLYTSEQDCAIVFNFNINNNLNCKKDSRCSGMSVRPVR